MITEDAINVGINVDNAEEAIKAIGALMVNSGLVEEAYTQGMLNVFREFGPYWVLTEGLAMPHARPEDGALKSGFALIVLDEPISFGHEEHDPVSLIFGMSAVDKDTHVENIRNLTGALSTPNMMDQLREVQTSEQACRLLNSIKE